MEAAAPRARFQWQTPRGHHRLLLAEANNQLVSYRLYQEDLSHRLQPPSGLHLPSLLKAYARGGGAPGQRLLYLGPRGHLANSGFSSCAYAGTGAPHSRRLRLGDARRVFDEMPERTVRSRRAGKLMRRGACLGPSGKKVSCLQVATLESRNVHENLVTAE